MTTTARTTARPTRLAGYLFALAAGAVWGTTDPLSTALYRAGEEITGIGYWRLVIGFAGLLVLRSRLRLSAISFAALFLLFNFNGHILAHYSVGHATRGGYFLFPWFVWLILRLLDGDRSWAWTLGMSVLMIEVGRRLGIGLYGVGMPGHFIVGIEAESGGYVDPFHAGQRLDRSGCKALFMRTQSETSFRSEHLARVGSRAILLRMLNNLLQSYTQRRTADSAWVARLLLCFSELPTTDRRRSAEILGSFGAFGEAAAALDALAADVGGTRAPKLAARARELRARAN